jgi:hypothetical protein
MVREKFGPVLVRRRLVLADSSRRAVTVSIGQPRRTPGTPDWECPFRITGGGLSRIDYGYGVDSMQALINALLGLRVVLESTGKSFSWLGADYIIGFPRVIPCWGDVSWTRRMERLVEREARGYVRALKQKRHARTRLERPRA